MSDEKHFTTRIKNKLFRFIPSYNIPPHTRLKDYLRPEHIARMEQFQLYWEYYKGKQHLPLKVKPNQPNLNVIKNLSKIVVNQGVYFLFGAGVKFDENLEARDVGQRTPAEQLLDRFWKERPEDNFNPDVLLVELGQNGGVTGVPVLRLYDTEPFPTVSYLNPASLDVITDPLNKQIIKEYRIFNITSENLIRQRIIKLDLGWGIITERLKLGTASSTWEKVAEDELWEWDFSPIFMGKNLPLANTIWGTSDLEEGDLNDSINRVASDINKIIFHDAYPTTIFEGAMGIKFGAGDSGIGKIIKTPPGVSSYNLEMTSDLVPSREFLKDLEETFYDTASATKLDPARVNVGALSGFALQILFSPLIYKTNLKQETYGAMLKAVNIAALRMMNYDQEIELLNIWGNALPASKREQVEVADILVRAGGDLEESLIFAGVDSDSARKISDTGLPLLPSNGGGFFPEIVEPPTNGTPIEANN